MLNQPSVVARPQKQKVINSYAILNYFLYLVFFLEWEPKGSFKVTATSKIYTKLNRKWECEADAEESWLFWN